MTQSVYDAHYYAHGCGRPYERNEWWLDFFQGIADRIIAEIAPTTVLDVGCAMGFLVEALRKRDVAAFGIDVSDYAVGQAHPSIRQYLAVAAATEALPAHYPDRFDLVVSIEVLEHLSRADGDRAIEWMCRLTDDVLFSSTPADYREATHQNVQPPEYWAGIFARHGFARDLEFDGAFLTPWARRFKRHSGGLPSVVRSYERAAWQLETAIREQRAALDELRSAAATSNLPATDPQVEHLELELAAWEARWAALQSSFSGRLMRRLQSTRAWLCPPGSSRDRLLSRMIDDRSQSSRSAGDTSPTEKST